MPAYARPETGSLAITFTRDGEAPEMVMAPDGYRAVSTAMRLIAMKDRLHAGDRLVVEAGASLSEGEV